MIAFRGGMSHPVPWALPAPGKAVFCGSRAGIEGEKQRLPVGYTRGGRWAEGSIRGGGCEWVRVCSICVATAGREDGRVWGWMVVPVPDRGWGLSSLLSPTNHQGGLGNPREEMSETKLTAAFLKWNPQARTMPSH